MLYYKQVMDMKKVIIIIVGIVGCFLLFRLTMQKTNVKSHGGEQTDNSMVHEFCTRQGEGSNIETELNYELYYTGDVLNVLISKEAVTSEDPAVLDQYEEAYKGIYSHYEGLDYYEPEVIREENTVTSLVVIDYDHIDIDQLIAIEGEKDNIFIDKVPSVSKWKELAKKFGTKCVVIEEE